MPSKADEDRRLMPPPSWKPPRRGRTQTHTLSGNSFTSEIHGQQKAHQVVLSDWSSPEVAQMTLEEPAVFDYVRELPLSFYSRVNMESNGVELHTRASQSNNYRLYSWKFRQVSAEFSGRLPTGPTPFVVTVEGRFQPVDLTQQAKLLEIHEGTNDWRLYSSADPTAPDLSQYRSLLDPNSNNVEMMRRAEDFSFSCGPWSYGSVTLQGFDDDGTPTVQVDSIPATFTIEEMPQSLF